MHRKGQRAVDRLQRSSSLLYLLKRQLEIEYLDILQGTRAVRTSTSMATGPHSSFILRMLFPWMKIVPVVEFSNGEDGELQCSDWLGCGPKALKSRLSGARLTS